jgi:hypothetical protein
VELYLESRIGSLVCLLFLAPFEVDIDT